MVELLHSFNLISNLMTVFNLSIKNSVKHLVVVVLFNLILSSNSMNLWSLTYEHVVDLKKQLDKNNSELDDLRKTPES